MSDYQVLGIDDDKFASDAISRILKNNGINVNYFNSPLEAIAHLAESPERYQLAIVDFQMDELNGDEVIKQLKKINPKLETVILSGNDNPEVIAKCKEAGAENFYSKETALETLPLLGESLKVIPTKTEEIDKPANAKLIQEVLELVGESNQLAQVANLVKLYSQKNSPILLQGDSGTGKEKIAKAVHLNSPRKHKRFITVNCAAIPSELLESELFGHEKGAFTHAVSSKMGKFTLANGGTIFLDEIGEMPVELQAKILRVLQEKEVTTVGGTTPLPSDFRVVAATNRNLMEEVKNGNFREDLYYRLHRLPINILPLSKRKDDIIPIANFLIEKEIKEMNVAKTLTRDSQRLIINYNWPGNVRQMESVLERSFIHSTSKKIEASTIKDQIALNAVDDSYQRLPTRMRTWQEVGFENLERQKELIVDALTESEGKKREAAEMIDIPYTTFLDQLKKLEIDSKKFVTK